MKRFTAALLVATLSACGSAASREGSPAAVPGPARSGVAVIEVGDELTAVGFGPDQKHGPRWSYRGAAAAPDGSAVFAAPGDAPASARTVLRLDLRTGDVLGSWTVEGAPEVDAVAPDGRWVALTERSPVGDSTVLTVLDPATGATARHVLSGDVEGEAFTVDGAHLFVIRHYEHHYRVELVAVATGAQEPTLSRDKVQGGDMTGGVVAAVLSPDRSILATLYRNPTSAPGHPGHEGSSPAFVHLADLQNAWTYCVDLPAPFGTGPAGDDVIATDGTGVVVGTTASGAVARIDAGAVHIPVPPTPLTVTVTPGVLVPRVPDSVTAIEGFERVVAVLGD